MLPESLFSSYKQYKSDTTKIASWLANSAEKCGWQPPTLAAPGGLATQETKAPKLKGCARKLAREAAAAEKKTPSSANNEKEPPKHIIRIKDFVPMAACVASNISSVRMPHGFLNLIRRCIIARSSTTDWYASNTTEEDSDTEEKTDSHSHFTSVLEDVFRTLMTSFPAANAAGGNSRTTETQSGQQQTTNDAKTAPLANLFELLAVEGADDDLARDEDVSADDSTAPESKAPPGTLKPRYEIEHDDNDVEEEFFFALQLFFCDLHRLKFVLEELWERYRDGEIDLTVAAVATNTAFDLVRKAESDFLREMPIPAKFSQFSRGGDLCYLNYIDISAKQGCRPEDTERPGDLFDFNRYDDVEHCFLVPYLCLKQFGMEVEERNGRIPMMSVEQERRLVSGPRSDLTGRERHEEDSTVLLSSVAVIASFVSVSNAPSEDEFCVGIRQLVKKQKLPLWLIFAAQNYLDVHHILRTDVGRGLEELQTAGTAARATLEQHFRFMKANKCELRDRKDESTCREIMKDVEEWGCTTQEAKYLNKYSTRKSGVRWDANCVVKKHPLLAGILKFGLHLTIQWEGILLVNSITTILSVAHLYNAVQVEGYLPKDKPWQDLDYVLNIHSSQDIFVGGRPTNIEDAAVRMSMAQGISPETFAKNRRSVGPKYSRKGSRELDAVCPVAGAFRDQYCSGASAELSTQLAEDLVHQLAFKELKTKKEISKKLLASLRSRGFQLSLEAFVDHLAEALQLEAPQYQFDYFALHRRTWTMLEEIKDRIRPIVEDTFNEAVKKKFNSDSGVVMIGSIIICMACDITKSSHLFNIKQSLQVDVEPLKITAAEMEKLIDEEGDVEMKRLQAVCPGFAESETLDDDGQSTDSQSQDENGQDSNEQSRKLNENMDSLKGEIPETSEQ
jgi:hypothetical protein